MPPAPDSPTDRPPFVAPDEHRAGDLLLRCYRLDDAAELHQAVMSSYEHLRPWMPWARPDRTPAESRAFVTDSVVRWLLGDGEWNVAVLRGGRLVGSTGFMFRGRSLRTGTAEIGMWVRAADAGGGLGTRILGGLVDWADEAWPFEKLTWHCDSRNVASARVAAKCGFTLEGRLRGHTPSADGRGRADTLVYGLVRGDARPWRG